MRILLSYTVSLADILGCTILFECSVKHFINVC